MQKHDLDCLIVFGLKGRERFEGYLANDAIDGVVIFPLDGEPLHLTWTHHRITRRMASSMQDVQFWIDNLRVGPYGPGIVAALNDMHLTHSRIGVVGLESRGAAELEGIVPYRTWSTVLAHLPQAQFFEVSSSFSELMLTKSAEELRLIEFAAGVGEKACQRMLEVTRPGVREAEIYAEIMHVLHSHSVMSVAPHLNMSVGLDDPGWAAPYWTYAGGESRKVQAIDLVQAEIFPCYAGIETQVQMSIAVGCVPQAIHDLHAVARRSYEAGLSVLRPGNRFSQLADAMAQPILDSQLYNMTPMIHSLSPGSFVGHIALNAALIPGNGKYGTFRLIPPTGDFDLEPGMVFAFEPNACAGLQRVNIGGTVVVGENGPLELNSLPCHLRNVS